jgi:hypothetical protein
MTKGEALIFVTGIHTKVNSKYRISSNYRAFETMGDLLYGWETILWRKSEIGKEEIANISVPNGNAQNIVEQHADIFNHIHANNGEYKESP